MTSMQKLYLNNAVITLFTTYSIYRLLILSIYTSVSPYKFSVF